MNIGTCEVTDLQYELLVKDLNLIFEANKIHNLTRIDSFDDGMLLHIEDSLAGLPEFKQAPTGLYADLGTGGGFPGIPLAIMSERETLLVDSVQKKMKVLDGVLEELGISDRVSTYPGRIEDLARERPREFAVITARALSSLPSLLELVSPLLQQQGEFICYKAHVTPEELEVVRGLEHSLGMKCVSKRDFVLSDNETQRCILVFKKYAPAALKLPRRVGMAQKKPLA